MSMLTIYSKDNCIQCMQVEALLRAKDIEFQVLKLDKEFTRGFLDEECARVGGPAPRSFPVLIKGDTYIGNLQDTKVKLSQGIL